MIEITKVNFRGKALKIKYLGMGEYEVETFTIEDIFISAVDDKESLYKAMSKVVNINNIKDFVNIPERVREDFLHYTYGVKIVNPILTVELPAFSYENGIIKIKDNIAMTIPKLKRCYDYDSFMILRYLNEFGQYIDYWIGEEENEDNNYNPLFTIAYKPFCYIKSHVTKERAELDLTEKEWLSLLSDNYMFEIFIED